MQKILEIIMDLQNIDAKLLKLEQSKGDLPAKVKLCSAEVDALRETLRIKREARDAYIADQASVEIDVAVAKARLEKYKTQLYQVKTNKEYDAITTEMETVGKAIDDAEFRIEELVDMISSVNDEVQELEAKLKAREESLEALRAELENRQAVTQEEEKALFVQRQFFMDKVPKQLLSTYERIRQGRGGFAVAKLQNGACSHCSTRIPPQRGLEIRMMNRINLCEVCGRILVWKADADSSSAE